MKGHIPQFTLADGSSTCSDIQACFLSLQYEQLDSSRMIEHKTEELEE